MCAPLMDYGHAPLTNTKVVAHARIRPTVTLIE